MDRELDLENVMKKFGTLAGVAALTAASATFSIAESPDLVDADPFGDDIETVSQEDIAPAGSLGAGAGPVIAGIAAIAVLGFTLSDSSSGSTPTSTSPRD